MAAGNAVDVDRDRYANPPRGKARSSIYPPTSPMFTPPMRMRRSMVSSIVAAQKGARSILQDHLSFSLEQIVQIY